MTQTRTTYVTTILVRLLAAILTILLFSLSLKVVLVGNKYLSYIHTLYNPYISLRNWLPTKTVSIS